MEESDSETSSTDVSTLSPEMKKAAKVRRKLGDLAASILLGTPSAPSATNEETGVGKSEEEKAEELKAATEELVAKIYDGKDDLLKLHQSWEDKFKSLAVKMKDKPLELRVNKLVKLVEEHLDNLFWLHLDTSAELVAACKNKLELSVERGNKVINAWNRMNDGWLEDAKAIRNARGDGLVEE